MKKSALCALFLSLVLALGACAGCGKKENNDSSGGNSSESSLAAETGDFLSLTAVDSYHTKIVNGSGMSGSDGSIHLHSALSSDMVKDDYGEFTFDIGHMEKLGEFYVWNYNATGKTTYGLKDVNVFISEDGENFTQFKSYVFAEADGKEGLSATNLLDGKVIDFCGAVARYIRLSASSNYGGEFYGLSEVRLFRYKQPIVAGNSISASPIERYVNGKWSAKEEDYNLTNGAGLSDSLSATATHDNDATHMATKNLSAIDFKLDLKGEYPISKLVIWNYNDPANLDYGLKEVRIRYSDDSSAWTIIGKYTLPKGTGEKALKPSLTVELDNVHAHYIQIEILSNYEGDKVGLSAATAFLGEGWYCDAASEYTALFSSYSGWSGADGIYSVNLDGKDYDENVNLSERKTFFVFSDTIVSEVDPVTRLRRSFYMPNNTSGVLTGGVPSVKNMRYYYPSNTKQSANIRPNPLEPSTASPSKSKYYWLGDTFVVGDKLYVYCLKIDTVDPSINGFSFSQTSVDLARYDIVNGEPDFNSLTLINDSQNRLCDISNNLNKWYFGGAVYQSTESAGALNPDGYIYIYGYNDINNKGRKLVVSRVKESEVEDFSSYEYLSSDGSFTKTVPSSFSFLADDVAPECSVSQIRTGENKGKLLFIHSHITTSPTIKMSMSDAPYEAFTSKTTVFSHDTCSSILGKGNNTYNAKAHPALSKSGELLISYNINGDDCFTYADIYRPRFLRLSVVASK